MQKMVAKRAWVKARTRTIKCGTCLMCDKVLMSDEGGWIINANQDYFCESHKTGVVSCFDEYLRQLKEFNKLNA